MAALIPMSGCAAVSYKSKIIRKKKHKSQAVLFLNSEPREELGFAHPTAPSQHRPSSCGEKGLTAADTICADIPFRSECRITDPCSEKESGNFFFLRRRGRRNS